MLILLGRMGCGEDVSGAAICCTSAHNQGRGWLRVKRDLIMHALCLLCRCKKREYSSIERSSCWCYLGPVLAFDPLSRQRRQFPARCSFALRDAGRVSKDESSLNTWILGLRKIGRLVMIWLVILNLQCQCWLRARGLHARCCCFPQQENPGGALGNQ
jgi:hypothetical protein